MLAVGREHVVLVIKGRNCADRDRLFAGIEMAKPGDLAARIHFSGLLLEASDQKHTAIEVEQLSLVHRQQRALSNMFVTFQGHKPKPPAPESASYQLKH